MDLKIANLTAAVESGAAIAPLVAQLTPRHTEREALLAAIGAAEVVGELTADRRAIERKVLERVATRRALVDGDVVRRRQFLREVLDGPIRFVPDGKQYRFRGEDTRGRLIEGLIGYPPYLASPPGFEPGFQP